MKRLNPWFTIPVAIAGVAGALIGRNVARVSCAPIEADGMACDSGGSEITFAIIGAIVAVIGVGVVVALVIRSLEEWRQFHQSDD